MPLHSPRVPVSVCRATSLGCCELTGAEDTDLNDGAPDMVAATP